MLSRLKTALDNQESEFIYNVLEIQNSSKNGQSAHRFWYDDFRENLDSREGDIYEFGVYRGSSLLSFALLAKRLGSKKHFWGFDSFSGFPGYSSQDELINFKLENGFSEKLLEDHKLLLELKSSNIKVRFDDQKLSNKLKNIGKSGLFEDTSYQSLLEKIDLLELDNITLVPGDFSETVPKHFSTVKPSVFSANIDCDLFSGYEICLPYVFKYLEIGGYIHLDEYYSLKYPGPKIATDNFLSCTKNAILKQNSTREGEFERYYILKK